MSVATADEREIAAQAHRLRKRQNISRTVELDSTHYALQSCVDEGTSSDVWDVTSDDAGTLHD